MNRIRVTRAVRLPDKIRVSRYRRAPELGPRILFFTGGSAIRSLSRKLKLYTHNSIHLVTPFDSGGSSAKLREAFGMMAVGDMRNRLIALADETVRGNPEIYRLFKHRLGYDADESSLADALGRMADGSHALMAAVPEPLRHIVRTHVGWFAEQMPEDFDLHGASIGNLVLTGGYLNNERDIDAVIFLFSMLVRVRGIVSPVADVSAHLVAELKDGTKLVGQHALTGKGAAPIRSPVQRLSLVTSLDDPQPATVAMSPKIEEFIAEADLICYPLGSFWSSVVANLLPTGIGRAIRDAEVPKVYVPNAGEAPEQLGMSIHDCVEVLHRRVCEDVGHEVPLDRVVNGVIVDSKGADYGPRLDLDKLAGMGVQIIDLPLATDDGQRLIDPQLLTETLLSLS